MKTIAATLDMMDILSNFFVCFSEEILVQHSNENIEEEFSWIN